MFLSNEKKVMKIGALVLLAYSAISISVYDILKYKNVAISGAILNSAIDILLFIPIYIWIMAVFFSFKRRKTFWN